MRRLRNLKLGEISAVDKPAQEGARLLLMKRAPDTVAKNTDVTKTDRTDEATGPDASTLNASEKTAMDPTQMEARIKELETEHTALKAKVAELEAQLGTADKTAELPVEEQKFAKALTPAERAAFVTKGATERAELAAPIYKSADGTVYFRGEEKLVELSKRTDAAEAKTVTVELTKRATDRGDLGALPLTVDEKVVALKALAKVPDAERALVEKMLAGGNAAAAMLKSSLGTSTGATVGIDSPDGEYMVALEKFAADQKTTPAKASLAFLGTPEGQRLSKAATASHLARK